MTLSLEIVSGGKKDVTGDFFAIVGGDSNLRH